MKRRFPSGCRLAGIDEAGRGPLAGPVTAAICILPDPCPIIGLKDSKQLAPEEREKLDEEIRSCPGVEFAVGLATSQEIDQYNILKATFLAMHRALLQLQKAPDLIIVDGNLAPSFGIPTHPIPQGDILYPQISAASILAKVLRDKIMSEFDLEYPQYNFKSHKGYGTPEHLKAIDEFGPCKIHRKSFEPILSLFRHTQLDLLELI